MKKCRVVLTVFLLLWLLFTPWLQTQGVLSTLRNGETYVFLVDSVNGVSWDPRNHVLRTCLTGTWYPGKVEEDVSFAVDIPTASIIAGRPGAIIGGRPVREIYATIQAGCKQVVDDRSIYRGKLRYLSASVSAPQGSTAAIYLSDESRAGPQFRFSFKQGSEQIDWDITLRAKTSEVPTSKAVWRLVSAIGFDLFVGPLIWIPIFFGGGH